MKVLTVGKSMMLAMVFLCVFATFYVLRPRTARNSVSENDAIQAVLSETDSQFEVSPTVVVTEIPTETPQPVDPLEATDVPSLPDSPSVTASPSAKVTSTPAPTEAPLIAHIPERLPMVTKYTGVSEYSYGNLQAKTLYQIDLSQAEASLMVISWPKSSSLSWSTDHTVTLRELQSLPIDEEEGNENEYFSGLLEVPQAKVFYLYSDNAIPQLKVSLLYDQEPDGSSSILATTQSTTGIYNTDAGASYTSLSVVTRDEWGANPSSWDQNSSANIDSASRFIWYPVYYKVSRIVVHHTATAPNTTTPAAAVRAIYRYHAYIREWGDIGYNFLIDQNGTIYQGKLGGDGTQGYHAFGGANRISLGISLIGDFTSTQPTSKARSALIKLLAEKAAFYGFSLKYSYGTLTRWKDQSYTVFGHKTSYRWDDASNSWSANQTACPGNAFSTTISGLVAEAETYRANNFASLKALTAEVHTAFSLPHDEGKIIVKYNVPENTDSAVIESYLPKYSGITTYIIDGNTVTITLESSVITHPVLGDSEYLIPPMGWTGYDNEYAGFTPALTLNGPEDRAKTLLKFFKLDPRVSSADVKNYLQIQ